MDNSFVTFEQARFLHVMGVDIPTNYVYTVHGNFISIDKLYNETSYLAPKLADVNQWLWEFYRVIIEIHYYGCNNIAYEIKGSQIESLNSRYCLQCLNSPNDALRRGLDEVIDLINSDKIISEAERLFRDMFKSAEEYGFKELYEKMKEFKENPYNLPGSENYRRMVLGDFQREICDLYNKV